MISVESRIPSLWIATAYRGPRCSCPAESLPGRSRNRSPRTDLVQLLVHGLDLSEVGRVIAKPFGVTGSLRVQPCCVLRVYELANRIRQVPVASKLAEFGHRLLIGAEADGRGCHTTIVRQARSTDRGNPASNVWTLDFRRQEPGQATGGGRSGRHGPF